ncbi:uncharacterized protein LOC142550820 [Primulina tabacum]|uniref:uncharacterized protein LOC142550820 n=1 Tax=Primulina tabacum TaxID=48773 RepID=UPI003F59C82B
MLEESESASAIPSSIWAFINSWFTPTVLFVLLNLMIGTITFTSTFTTQEQPQNLQESSSQNENNQPKISKSSSFLQRLKSINFHPHFTSHDTQNLSINKKSSTDSDNQFQAQVFETQSHYFFQENPLENLETTSQSQGGFIFEQAHVKNPLETQTQFIFEPKDSSLEGFKPAHEEKGEETEWKTMDEIYSHLQGGHFSRTKSDTEPASGKIPAKLPARMKKSASLKSPFRHLEEEDIVEGRRLATVKENGNAKASDGDEEVDAKADDFINKFKQQLKLQRLDSVIRYKDVVGRATGGR